MTQGFPGGPAVETPPSAAGWEGAGFICGQGAEIPHAKTQNMKKKQYGNKFNKDFKMVHVQNS